MAQFSIRVVIPYFGQWPFWMPFFFRSCAENPSIDWLFFTDCGVHPDAPQNVQFKQLSFTDYCALVSERLQIDFQPAHAYKLCDIKPALGFIHHRELAGYDFWAFSDIDLVYGDLRTYFDEVRLTKYDLLSTHARRISGHFVLLRNNQRMREAFTHVRNWQSALANPEHLAFDEGAFSRLFIRHKNWPLFARKLADRFNPWRRVSEFLEAYSTPGARERWIDGTLDFPGSWIWQDGSVSNDRDGARQFPYFHFISWKGGAWRERSSQQLIGPPGLHWQSCWKISAQGFDTVHDNVARAAIASSSLNSAPVKQL